MEQPKKEIISLFIHLGGLPPKHLILNIKRFLELFPRQRAVLLLSEGTNLSQDANFETVFIKESDFPALEEMEKVHDFNFRNGFWRNTFLRLFAIEYFQNLHPNSGILHVESDVVLMPSFPWGFFESSTKLKWLRVHDGADVAALVYSPSHALMAKLTDELLSYSKTEPSITDMSAMFKFAVLHPDEHEYLPSLTWVSNQSEGLEAFRLKEQSSTLGYFDPLAIGIWLFGQDPKNNYGFTRRYKHQAHHDLDPRKLDLRMDENGDVIDKEGFKVFSFHLHSKNTALFGPNWKNEMGLQIKQAKQLANANSFSMFKFREAISERSIASHIWINLNQVGLLRDLKRFSFVNRILFVLRKLLKIG